jgi:hypothetical protein
LKELNIKQEEAAAAAAELFIEGGKKTHFRE